MIKEIRINLDDVVTSKVRKLKLDDLLNFIEKFLENHYEFDYLVSDVKVEVAFRDYKEESCIMELTFLIEEYVESYLLFGKDELLTFKLDNNHIDS